MRIIPIPKRFQLQLNNRHNDKYILSINCYNVHKILLKDSGQLVIKIAQIYTLLP